MNPSDSSAGSERKGRVTVYQSMTYNRALGKHLLSEIHATRETIKRARAIVVEESAIEVEASDLDEHGRYMPHQHKETQ